LTRCKNALGRDFSPLIFLRLSPMNNIREQEFFFIEMSSRAATSLMASSLVVARGFCLLKCLAARSLAASNEKIALVPIVDPPPSVRLTADESIKLLIELGRHRSLSLSKALDLIAIHVRYPHAHSHIATRSVFGSQLNCNKESIWADIGFRFRNKTFSLSRLEPGWG
jgi:hypothetical protein